MPMRVLMHIAVMPVAMAVREVRALKQFQVCERRLDRAIVDEATFLAEDQATLTKFGGKR